MMATYVEVNKLRRRVQLYENLAVLENTNKYEGKLKAAQDKLAKAEAALPTTGNTLPDNVVLDVKDLCMYFGGVKAVDGLSFQVKKGEIFGLIGPNGDRKSVV